MTLKELKEAVSLPFFWDYQIKRHFNKQDAGNINMQLSRMVARKNLIRLKRGLYAFPENLDNRTSEFVLAQILYEPSYISLETALNVHGIIPDVPQNVTSISPTTTKKIQTSIGTFLYSKIQNSLYFGYEKIKDANTLYYYNMATAEKAFLDYIYVRKIKTTEDLRVDKSQLKSSKLKELCKNYPSWVKKVVNE